MVRVLGIDASTRCTGYGIVENDEYLLGHGTIDFKNEKDLDVRIDGMIRGIIKLFDKYCPDIVYIEDSWNGKNVVNVQTTKKLTNIIGATRCICIQRRCLFNSIYPSEWRAAIGIDGGKNVKREEFKARAIAWARNKYGLDVSDDEAEGVCIAYAGTIMNNNIFAEDLF